VNPTHSSPATITVRRARIAITAVFVMHGLLFASWTAHIPVVQRTIGATNGELGTALLGAPVGSVLAMILVGKLIPRVGSRAVIRVALVGYGITGLLVGLADSLPMLFIALLSWGAFQGGLDVAMNAHGTEVERLHGGIIMSGFHGFWSVGALTGALIGATLVGLGVNLDAQLLPMGLVAIALVGALSRWLLPPEHLAVRPDEAPITARRGFPRAVIILGGIAFASMLCEGATADWSAVHLRTDMGASASTAGLAYAAYAGAMVIVRMLASRLFRKVAPARIVPVLAILAALGMTLGLASESVPLTILGYAALGIGLATVVPTAFTAASKIPGGKPGVYISQVAALGWAGYVCGPPIIGHLSELTGLPIALALVPVLAATIAGVIWISRLFPTAPVLAPAAGPATEAAAASLDH
jgi:MFS family permease